jgi:hypothetical protein
MDIKKLEKLHSLKEKGILSEKEFEAEKAKLLAGSDYGTDKPTMSDKSEKSKPVKTSNLKQVEVSSETLGIIKRNGWIMVAYPIFTFLVAMFITHFPQAFSSLRNAPSLATFVGIFLSTIIPLGIFLFDALFLRKEAGYNGKWVKYYWLCGFLGLMTPFLAIACWLSWREANLTGQQILGKSNIIEDAPVKNYGTGIPNWVLITYVVIGLIIWIGSFIK